MHSRVEAIVERAQALSATFVGSRQLAAMLRQSAPHFDGLSTGEVERARGQILAGFEKRALPPEATAAIREELRTSSSPIVLAGAARALRGVETGRAEWRALLQASAERLALRDEYVRWDADKPTQLTACDEIAVTLAGWECESGPCCGGSAVLASPRADVAAPPMTSLNNAVLERARVEDQDGQRLVLSELLESGPCLIGFFYTRCMNPAKCSLTIARLATVARFARQYRPGEWKVVAISYDPEFDTPARLRDFGAARAFPFGDDARMIRCVTRWASVRQAFSLQVGYGGATINEHARECFMISKIGSLVRIDCEELAEPARLLDRG